MRLITNRIMSSDKVRAMCINHSYCTNCDISEYATLLNSCNSAVDDSDILVTAWYIYNRSDTEKLMETYGCTQKELIESICFNLINECTYTTVELTECDIK